MNDDQLIAAVEAVSAAIDSTDEGWWLDSDTVDCDRLAEIAIYAYHQHLESIGAKVLVPGKASEITKPQTVFYDGDDMMRRVAYKRFEDGTIETKDGCDYAADLDVFIELPLSDES